MSFFLSLHHIFHLKQFLHVSFFKVNLPKKASVYIQCISYFTYLIFWILLDLILVCFIDLFCWPKCCLLIPKSIHWKHWKISLPIFVYSMAIHRNTSTISSNRLIQLLIAALIVLIKEGRLTDLIVRLILADEATIFVVESYIINRSILSIVVVLIRIVSWMELSLVLLRVYLI